MKYFKEHDLWGVWEDISGADHVLDEEEFVGALRHVFDMYAGSADFG